MDNINYFFNSFIDSPRDAIEPRLAFAGWLETQDDVTLSKWGRFIRLQIQTADLPLDAPARKPLIAEEKQLWQEYHTQWGQHFINTLDLENIHRVGGKPCTLNPEWITYDRGIPDLAYRLDIGDNYCEISNIAYQHEKLQKLFDQKIAETKHLDYLPIIDLGMEALRPDDAVDIKAAVSSGIFDNSLQLAQAIKSMSTQAMMRSELLPRIEQGLRFMLDYGPDATAVISGDKTFQGYDTLGTFAALSKPPYERVRSEDNDGPRDAPIHIPHPQFLKLLMQVGCRPVHAPDKSSPVGILSNMVFNSRSEIEDNIYWPWKTRTSLGNIIGELSKMESSHGLG